MRAIKALAAVLALSTLLAGPAAAQLPPLPPVPGLPPGGGEPPPSPPPGGGQQPPPAEPSARGAEALSYQGDPGHTGSSSEQRVFGPLQRIWTRRFNGPVNQPLVVGGKVIVNVARTDGHGYGSFVIALDPRTGRTQWKRPTDGVYYSAPIAATGGRVFSADFDGVVRAFDAASGEPAWTVDLDSSFTEVPVAADGLVFVARPDTLTALSAADGSLRWSKPAPQYATWPVVDSERVYVVDGCDAIAYALASGDRVWVRNRDTSCIPAGVPIVAGGRLFGSGPDGATFDAATGADLAPIPGDPLRAVSGDLGYRPNGAAVGLADGAVRWRFRRADASLSPLVVGATLYLTGGQGRLFGLDRLSGRLLSVADLPSESGNSVGGITPGMAAGAGVLTATGGHLLSGYRAVLQPPAGGLDIAATRFDVVSGRRTGLVAGLGSALRSRVRRVTLQYDDHPFGRFRRGGRFRRLADGTTYVRMRVRRNRRVRFVAAGKRSPAIMVSAVPRARWKVRRVSTTMGRLTLRLRADTRFRVGGRRAVVYFGDASKRRYRRLGSARIRQTGRGRARADMRFRLLRRVGRKDTIVFCVVGLPRLGYGRNNGFERRCGRRTITFRAANRRK